MSKNIHEKYKQGYAQAFVNKLVLKQVSNDQVSIGKNAGGSSQLSEYYSMKIVADHFKHFDSKFVITKTECELQYDFGEETNRCLGIDYLGACRGVSYGVSCTRAYIHEKKISDESRMRMRTEYEKLRATIRFYEDLAAKKGKSRATHTKYFEFLDYNRQKLAKLWELMNRAPQKPTDDDWRAFLRYLISRKCLDMEHAQKFASEPWDVGILHVYVQTDTYVGFIEEYFNTLGYRDCLLFITVCADGMY